MVGLLTINLVACSQSKKSETSEVKSEQSKGQEKENDKKTLRIAGESWQVTKLFLNEAAEQFMKAHPEVTVEVQTYAEPTVISNYSINWQKGDTPCDLVVIDGASFAEQLQKILYMISMKILNSLMDIQKINLFQHHWKWQSFITNNMCFLLFKKLPP